MKWTPRIGEWDQRECVRLWQQGLEEERTGQNLGSSEGQEPGTDASHRRAVSEDDVLWQSQDRGRTLVAEAAAESQTGATADANHGNHRHLPAEEDLLAGGGPSRVSVLAAWPDGGTSQSSVVQRHHLHPAALRLHVPRGRDGLLQPLGSELAIVEHARHGVLSRRAR